MGDNMIAAMFAEENNLPASTIVEQEIVPTTTTDDVDTVENADEVTPADFYIQKSEETSYVDSVVDDEEELANVTAIVVKAEDVNDIVNIANKEVATTGDLTNETAIKLNSTYNELLTMLGDSNIEQLSVETALAYKKEVLALTIESGIGGDLSSGTAYGVLVKIKEKLMQIIKAALAKLIEYGHKFLSLMSQQEITAKELANYISKEVSDFKIDKWETFIPFADILGNFTVLKNFNVTEITEYIKFNNTGVDTGKLVELYKQGVSKGTLVNFRELVGTTSAYDLSSYFKDKKLIKVLPIDVSGKTATCLVSEHLDVDGTNKSVLSRVTFPLVVDPKFRSAVKPTDPLKSVGLLPRLDLIAIANTVSDQARLARNNIKDAYKQVDEVRKIAESFSKSGDSEFNTDLLKCTSLLVSTIRMSTRVGLFSNGFIIGTVGKMAKLYKKQNQNRK